MHRPTHGAVKEIADRFIRFDTIYECDGWTDTRTDRQTPHDG